MRTHGALISVDRFVHTKRKEAINKSLQNSDCPENEISVFLSLCRNTIILDEIYWKSLQLQLKISWIPSVSEFYVEVPLI